MITVTLVQESAQITLTFLKNKMFYISEIIINLSNKWS